jgi:hypothetical protein
MDPTCRPVRERVASRRRDEPTERDGVAGQCAKYGHTDMDKSLLSFGCHLLFRRLSTAHRCDGCHARVRSAPPRRRETAPRAVPVGDATEFVDEAAREGGGGQGVRAGRTPAPERRALVAGWPGGSPASASRAGFAGAMRVPASLSAAGTPSGIPSCVTRASVPPSAPVSVVVIVIVPRNAVRGLGVGHLGHPLVRRGFREVAAVRAGVRGRPAGAGRSVVGG